MTPSAQQERDAVLAKGAGERLSEELYGIRGLLWSRCKLRKWAECGVSGEDIEPGSLAYRPISNGNQRMRRVSIEAMEGDHIKEPTP